MPVVANSQHCALCLPSHGHFHLTSGPLVFDGVANQIDHQLFQLLGIRRHATLGSATVPLYGAELGEHTRVAAHSVVMKREHLLPGLGYEGSPTRARTYRV